MTENFFKRIGTEHKPRHSRNVEVQDSVPTTESESGPYLLKASRSWAEGDGKYWASPPTRGAIPSGVYRMGVSTQVGPYFERVSNDTDNLVALPDSESAKILAEIETFRGLREKFRAHGFLYKRGILLWGPPGSGKTCTLQMLIRLLMKESDSVAVLVERPNIAAECLQLLRRLEPDRLVVAILEDLDALCERFGESEYLALLDGENQVDNICYLATTNYPERLDKRFVDRPSRFDTVRRIGMPSAEARAVYLKAKVPDMGSVALGEYVVHSSGFSIAHLRELIILTRCFDVPLRDAVGRLKEMRDEKSSQHHQDRLPVGFTS